MTAPTDPTGHSPIARISAHPWGYSLAMQLEDRRHNLPVLGVRDGQTPQQAGAREIEHIGYRVDGPWARQNSDEGGWTAPITCAEPVTAKPTDPMPVFTIKAKDELAFAAIRAYRLLCARRGLLDQAAEVDKAWDEIADWQARNPDAVKLPDHPHVPATEPADADLAADLLRRLKTAEQSKRMVARHAAEKDAEVAEADERLAIAKADVARLESVVARQRLRLHDQDAAIGPDTALRGSGAEAWLKAARDEHPREVGAWQILDALLDDYRLHSDTGTPLGVDEVRGG